MTSDHDTLVLKTRFYSVNRKYLSKDIAVYPLNYNNYNASNNIMFSNVIVIAYIKYYGTANI